MKRALPLLFLLPAAAALAVKAGDGYVTLRGHRITVEVAADDASRARGLMFRDRLAADHGMLFVFVDDAPREFWMKNTRIPLDMLFFDAAGKLVALQRDAQPCRQDPCAIYPSNAPARYVLELAGGSAARLGVAPGDVLSIHADFGEVR
ncbi:hypothetical protein MBSD_n2651 [Mizugakiibacter sediminis]|uniref:ACR family protein n=1 Tax=Mizugakiibacter sediminis TaxID=1475481 RepID=A0A0K8QR23_9GAMM|nr:DUF192 domain-containing protein [Mizugakiibacter sediminis]GAP67330.1 hypothetical protein MBSD_n2651 [Mizugakiibacter sediminis]